MNTNISQRDQNAIDNQQKKFGKEFNVSVRFNFNREKCRKMIGENIIREKTQISKTILLFLSNVSKYLMANTITLNSS